MPFVGSARLPSKGARHKPPEEWPSVAASAEGAHGCEDLGCLALLAPGRNLRGREADVTEGSSNPIERVIDPALNARMAELIDGLDLAAEFEADGSRYSELDELGQVVVHLPSGEVVPWHGPDDTL